MERTWNYAGMVWILAVNTNADTVIQSLGWEHYEVHEPEPHILLFKYVFLLTKINCVYPTKSACRRPINYQPPAQ